MFVVTSTEAKDSKGFQLLLIMYFATVGVNINRKDNLMCWNHINNR